MNRAGQEMYAGKSITTAEYEKGLAQGEVTKQYYEAQYWRGRLSWSKEEPWEYCTFAWDVAVL